MQRTRFIAAAAVALAVALAAAAPATARTKRFRPLDFVAKNTASDYGRSPLGVFSFAGVNYFYAPLRLPKGATVTDIRLYSFGSAATRAAALVKSRPAAEVVQLMAEVSSATANLYSTPAPVAGSVNAAAATVEPGYLYDVMVMCSEGTGVMAVDVDYTP